MCLLAWHQQGHQTTGRNMSHISETSSSGTKATTRIWLHDIWWKWILSYCWVLLYDTLVWKMPTSQCNSAKTITVLKELYAKHGIPEVIWSDNGPQFASHLFTEFTKDWNIKHGTSSSRNPRSNGEAESVVKIVRGLLTHAKCSGQDPYLALLAYRSTPVDSYLWSPVNMLCQHALYTTVPQRIKHKDPHDSMCSWSWLLHHQGHWWNWVQMSMRPHSWTTPRCCQAWLAHQVWNDWTTHHHSTNLRICFFHSTTISCSYNIQTYCSPKPCSRNLHPVDDTCNCRCTPTNWQNWCLSSLIWLCQ